jgi:predicted methyltransferase
MEKRMFSTEHECNIFADEYFKKHYFVDTFENWRENQNAIVAEYDKQIAELRLLRDAAALKSWVHKESRKMSNLPKHLIMAHDTTESWTGAIAIAIASLKDSEGREMKIQFSRDFAEHIDFCKQIAKQLRGEE